MPALICRRTGTIARMVFKPLSASVLNAAYTLRQQGMGWERIAREVGTTPYLIRSQLEPSYSAEKNKKQLLAAERRVQEDPLLELLRKHGHEYAE